MSIYQEQARYEINTWLRMLDYHQQENVYMKTRIAEILKSNVAKEVLERLEHYLTLLLNKDAVIALLRRDIIQFADKVTNHERLDGALLPLLTDMQKMEHEFNALRAGFHEHLRSIISS